MALYDIFNLPIHRSVKSRQHEWSRLMHQVSNFGLANSQYSFAELNQLVLDGFLSPRSACNFLLGKASLYQIVLLDRFVFFIQTCMSEHILSSARILLLWQKKENAVDPGSIFPSPLAELDFDDASNLDFSSEVAEYDNVVLRDLQKL